TGGFAYDGIASLGRSTRGQCAGAAHAAFFICCGEDDYRVLQWGLQKRFYRFDHHWKKTFHVRCAQAKKFSVPFGELEGIALPPMSIVGNRIAVARQHQAAITFTER